jgi:hypothetical protein
MSLGLLTPRPTPDTVRAPELAWGAASALRSATTLELVVAFAFLELCADEPVPSATAPGAATAAAVLVEMNDLAPRHPNAGVVEAVLVLLMLPRRGFGRRLAD